MYASAFPGTNIAPGTMRPVIATNGPERSACAVTTQPPTGSALCGRRRGENQHKADQRHCQYATHCCSPFRALLPSESTGSSKRLLHLFRMALSTASNVGLFPWLRMFPSKRGRFVARGSNGHPGETRQRPSYPTLTCLALHWRITSLHATPCGAGHGSVQGLASVRTATPHRPKPYNFRQHLAQTDVSLHCTISSTAEG